MKKPTMKKPKEPSAKTGEEGHAYAWGGGSLLFILLIVVLLILIFRPGQPREMRMRARRWH